MELSDGTEAIVIDMGQHEWEEMMKATGMDKLNLTKDVLSFMRLTFEISFNRGQNVMMETMKHIYETDFDLFEDFFEPEEVLLN